MIDIQEVLDKDSKNGYVFFPDPLQLCSNHVLTMGKTYNGAGHCVVRDVGFEA